MLIDEWIPYAKGLAKRPEVLRIARAIEEHPRWVVGALLEFWAWVDSETDDGFLPGLTIDDLVRILSDVCPLFFRTLSAVGWLHVDSTGVTIPNFDKWLSRSAKKRARERRRKRYNRNENDDFSASCPQSVRDLSASKDTANGTTKTKTSNKEKEKVKKEKDLLEGVAFPKQLDSLKAKSALEKWLTFKGKIKKPYKTSMSIESLLNQWAEKGEERFCEAVENSIANGYQGLFEPSERQANRPASGNQSRLQSETDYSGIGEEVGTPPDRRGSDPAGESA